MFLSLLLYFDRHFTEQIVSSQEPLVWVFPTGTEIRLALTPLYPSVPLTASLDPQLYELLELVDAVLVGRIREQQYCPARTIGGDTVSDNPISQISPCELA